MPKNELDLVENPSAHEEIETARSVPEAANAQQSLEGYAAINSAPDSEMAQAAVELNERKGEGAG